MPLVAEIAIERADLGFGKGYVPAPKSEGVVQLPDLLRQIEQAWDAGIRVLLVSVDSTGGSAAAGRLLFHALRCFSELGGRVVAYVDARALSTASLFILGADYVVMNPQALVGIHSPLLSNPSGDEVEGAYLARMRRQDGAVYQARTLLPPETIAAFLDRHGTLEKPGGVLFPTEWAQAFGFVDFVADRRRARRLARRLARGEEVSSPRHAELARRGVVPEVAALVEQLRAEAVSFLAALRAGR
jgi:ATP-dependent protease ClpP protease subunit